VLLAGVGAIGRPFGWVMLTTMLGPTAHLLLAHPDSVGARLRSAVLDHAAAIVAGPGRLAALGLWGHASAAAQEHDSARSRAGRCVRCAAASRPPWLPTMTSTVRCS
jgi:hypothetical protein